MEKALAHSAEFVGLLAQAKAHAATAGWFFLQAKEVVGDGNWGDYVACFSDRIGRRTVTRYMEFTLEVIEWAQAERPALTSQMELLNHGIEMALESPRTFTQLLRELKLMRRFGEYDPERYQQKKLSEGGDQRGKQLELDFGRFTTGLRQLARLPEIPADTDLDLDELEHDLEAALTHVRELKGTAGRTLDV